MKSALVYARLGWGIVPLHDVTAGVCSCNEGADCRSSGKHPRSGRWQLEATSDEATVTEWVAQWPDANVGVATGAVSGFFALDVDPDKGGAESLEALLEEHGELPHTVQAITGSGGSHYLFALPDFRLSNTAGQLGDGLDTRGEGGQIVVAPSVSSKGPYKWVHPPWSTPIAAAPAWMLTALRTKATEPTERAVNRGYYPPASRAVLDGAAAALSAHGPAIDGKGGGLHTVQAGAILTHDWALTDDEAWPLFEEWNETCQPPWELEGRDSLRVMLARGRKYGKADYGCKRALDSRQACFKMVADWQQTPNGDPMELIRNARTLAWNDPGDRELALNELKSATGMGVKAIDLKPCVAVEKPVQAGAIEVTPRLAIVADQAVEAIAPAVFQRGGILCEIAKNDRTAISDLETARIQDLMSRASKYVRYDGERGLVEQAAPIAVAQILHARRMHSEKVRVIEAVTTAPIFLADGTILQDRGYNAQARVFLEPSVAVDVLDEPTRDDARAAVALFQDLLSDFNFLEQADFSTWLAALLSPLVKSATKNAPSPLFCISAASPGAGKSLLANLITIVVTGNRASTSPYNPKDPGEWGKRLTAFVKGAAPVVVFDNANGTIGDEGLDRLITSSSWSDRILGASDAPALPNVTTWIATGNNIEPIADTTRRSAFCRIDVLSERPQERSGFAHDPLDDYAEEHRSELLSAALTILRAYHLAGRPNQRLAPWGSFTAWSQLVRGALVWSGLADPFLTQRRAAADLNEPENEALDFWIATIDATAGGDPAAIVASANARGARDVLNLREDITAWTLRKFLGRFLDRPRKQRRIRRNRDTKTGAVTFYVEKLSA